MSAPDYEQDQNHTPQQPSETSPHTRLLEASAICGDESAKAAQSADVDLAFGLSGAARNLAEAAAHAATVALKFGPGA